MVSDMITKNDWKIHAKATKSMAQRALNHGDVQAATTLVAAAHRMEQIAESEGNSSLAGHPELWQR
jgi:hypothetical protein